MEVEIISRESIKPSSPTPNHLRTYKISLLDQLIPPMFVPILVFVPANQASTTTKTSEVLKKYLSQTLTLYYPLAGKANDNLLSVHCNDEGILYVTARVNPNLYDYLKNPDVVKTIPKFLPDICYTELKPGGHVGVIQETVFSCGGIAIAVVVPHNIFDAASFITFMRTWASFARESNAESLFPNFSAASIFPQTSTPLPQDLIPAFAFQSVLDKNKTKFVVKRFVFDRSAINKLKEKAMRLGVQNPTRAEVVFATLLKCIISALKVKSGGHVFPTFVTSGVNLRRKAVPPFSEGSAGNFVLPTGMLLSQVDDTELFVRFMLRMRETISKFNGDFVKRLEGDGGMKTFSKYAEEFRESCSMAAAIRAEPISLNSWCNFGLYEVDFGWGKPLWIPFASANVSFPFFSIFLMDTRHGNGIEAWTNLDEQLLPLIGHDKEVLSLTSLDPTPLEICSVRSNL